MEFCLSVASSKTHEESFEESEFLLKIFDFLLDVHISLLFGRFENVILILDLF